MKNTLLYIAAFIYSVNLFAQDTPCTATSITSNTGCNTGDNTGATADGHLASCWGGGVEDNSIWFEVTATNDSLTVSTDYAGTSLTDTELAVYSSSDNTCTGTLTEVGCDDDGGTSCGLCSVVTLTTLTVGDTYFVQVDGYGGSVGDFCLSITEPLSTAPDYGTSCELAHQMNVSDVCYTIADGNVGDGNNLTSTNSIDQSCSAADDASDNGYWTTFTANDNTTTIDMIDFNGGATSNYFDISIFTGTCGSFTEIDCRSVPSKDNNYSIATTSGTTYYMFITNGSNYAGEIRRVSVCSSVACTAPANDACANAISVTDGDVYNGTSACATSDLALCSGSTENNIWYSWTVPATWTDGDNAFVSLTSQDCYISDPTAASSGSQLSVYNADETCATIIGGTGECMVFTNPNSDENFYGEFSPVIGSTYMINIDGYGGDACTFDFQVNNKAPIVLPIVLSNFDANYNESLDVVEIAWGTQSETNNDFFTVEKTKDGQLFEKVGIVDGANNSTGANNYRLIDNNPYKGISYYRLKQTDYDGAYEYSQLVSVSVAIDFDNLKFIPNPAKNYGDLSFSASKTGDAIVKVHDVSGRVVLEKHSTIEKGVNTITLDLSSLNGGMYFLSITNNKEIANLKFVKK